MSLFIKTFELEKTKLKRGDLVFLPKKNDYFYYLPNGKSPYLFDFLNQIGKTCPYTARFKDLKLHLIPLLKSYRESITGKFLEKSLNKEKKIIKLYLYRNSKDTWSSYSLHSNICYQLKLFCDDLHRYSGITGSILSLCFGKIELNCPNPTLELLKTLNKYSCLKYYFTEEDLSMNYLGEENGRLEFSVDFNLKNLLNFLIGSNWEDYGLKNLNFSIFFTIDTISLEMIIPKILFIGIVLDQSKWKEITDLTKIPYFNQFFNHNNDFIGLNNLKIKKYSKKIRVDVILERLEERLKNN